MNTYTYEVIIKADSLDNAEAIFESGVFNKKTLQSVTGPAVKVKPSKPGYLTDPNYIQAMAPMRDYLATKEQESKDAQAAFAAQQKARQQELQKEQA